MPGLNLSGGVSVANGGTATSSGAPAATATEMGFGPGYTQPGSPSGGLLSFLTPNDPSSHAFWIGALCGLGLVWLRHSLPR